MDDQQSIADPGSRLLPAGLADGLPPEAGHESLLVARLVARFAAQGYALVKPPLVEFEESLLNGIGAALREHCFRLMDPVSQRMMGVRPDMTPQVARIARTRLARAPRPLRLCYAGEVLRVRGTQLRPARQFEQVGAELIGASSAAADKVFMPPESKVTTATRLRISCVNMLDSGRVIRCGSGRYTRSALPRSGGAGEPTPPG